MLYSQEKTLLSRLRANDGLLVYSPYQVTLSAFFNAPLKGNLCKKQNISLEYHLSCQFI